MVRDGHAVRRGGAESRLPRGGEMRCYRYHDDPGGQDGGRQGRGEPDPPLPRRAGPDLLRERRRAGAGRAGAGWPGAGWPGAGHVIRQAPHIPGRAGISHPARPRGAEFQDLAQRRPGGGVFGQARSDQGAQVRRTSIQVRLVVQDPVRDRRVVPLAKGRPAECGVDGQRPEPEHIDRRGDRLVQDLLGRHEQGRAHHDAGPGQRGRLQRAGNPEIDHPRPIRRQQHVGRLEVTVHDPGRVNGLQRLGHAGDQPEHHRPRHRAVPGDRLLQRRAGHVGGDQPRRRGHRIGVEQLRRVQPVYSPGGLDLLPETRPELRVVAEFWPHYLQRHQPSGGRGRQVDPPHPARAEPGAQPVAADLGGIVVSQRLHTSPFPVRPSGKTAISPTPAGPSPRCV